MDLLSGFSDWLPWQQREKYSGIRYPGIYLIAISSKTIAGSRVSWGENIVYIGMTCSKAGLKGRLRQFDSTIAMKRSQHGGAERFLYAHRRYDSVVDRLYVALAHVVCDPARGQASDLRSMGLVVKAEYDALATFFDALERLPQFNDKARSPKFKF